MRMTTHESISHKRTIVLLDSQLSAKIATLSAKFFSYIRYHGSSSSIKRHVYHHVGGKDTHPWSATKVGNPIPATIPVTKKQQTTLTLQTTLQNCF